MIGPSEFFVCILFMRRHSILVYILSLGIVFERKNKTRACSHASFVTHSLNDTSF